MNEVIIQAFVDRIKAGMMSVEQVPELYRHSVQDECQAIIDTQKE